MAAALTQEEEQIVRHFMEVVNLMRKEQCLGPISWSTAIKFLCARKFDVARAVALYEQHEATRYREGLTSFDPAVDPLKSELETEKFTILPTRDPTGAAIAVFTARTHSPQISTHQTTLQGIVYQLDVALESIETQKAGLVFIYDMSDSKYSNFDYDLSKKILMLLKGGYPAKLKKVLIVTAPLWFKAPFRILRLFVREKLRDRVYTVSIPQLALHIPRESLPFRLGGTLTVAHDEWLLHCHKTITNKNNEENGMACTSTPAPNGNAFNSKLNSLEEYSDSGNNHSHFTENGGEDTQKTGNKTSQLWQDSSANHAGETSPQLAASSASSGFSDDECLHNETSQTLDINQFIECILQKGKAGLVAEYLEIKTRPPCGTFEEAKKPCNGPKNRYSDVLCYDHSRVVLSQIDGEEGSTYINANFVDGYKQKNAFISTQGPLPRTSADFWRMVWEQHVLVIAMTTRCSEKTRNKCYCYWPEEEISDELTYGQFRITNCSVEKFKDFVISKLQITNLDTDETRDVTHYQYVSWPDYGVPKASELLEFIREVREGQENMLRELGDKWAGHSRGPPIVVHCSAGIGRTGSFCTLDISLSRLEDTGLIDVRGTVEKIRSQRAHSIQMPEQYIFCHSALIEFAYIKGLIDTLPDLSVFEGSVADDHD